jgi:hypothetical protein
MRLNTGHVVEVDEQAPPPVKPAPPEKSSRVLPDVLVCVSDYADNFVNALRAYGDLGSVTFWNARYSNPTLADLLNYDCVVVYPNYAMYDGPTLGNRLAQYVDAEPGNNVILGVWCTYYGGYSLGGQIVSEEYSPITNPFGSSLYSSSSIGDYDAASCYWTVHAYNPSLCGYYRDPLELTTGSTWVADFQDGYNLASYKARPNGSIVASVNLYPGDYTDPCTPSMQYIYDMYHSAIICADQPVNTPTPTISPTPTASATPSPSPTPPPVPSSSATSLAVLFAVLSTLIAYNFRRQS